MLLSIQALLSAPNPDDPLANDVAEQWKKNESHAIETGPYKIYSFFIFDLLKNTKEWEHQAALQLLWVVTDS